MSEVEVAGEVAFLGLGANVGDALATLHAAVLALDEVDGVAVEEVSSVYRTAPWPPPGDPRAVPQDDYRNLVVRARTTCEPQALLAATAEIERRFGRDRSREQRWGPRPLDIDLLLVGDRQLVTDTLTLPHPRIAERAFVLVPLLEVAPGGALPDGRRLTRLLSALAPIEGIDLDVRLDGLPSRRIPRPEGPLGGPARLDRRPDES